MSVAAKVTVGVAGGIAAYRAVELVRRERISVFIAVPRVLGLLRLGLRCV